MPIFKVDSYIKIDFQSFSNRILSYPWGESYTFLHFPAFFAVFRRFCFAFNPKSYTFLHFPTLSYTHETRSPSNFPTLSYTSYTSYTSCFSFTPGSLCISYTYCLPPSPHQVRTKSVPSPYQVRSKAAPFSLQFRTVNAHESCFPCRTYAEKPYHHPTKTGALIPA
jgi:hypothetical protein